MVDNRSRSLAVGSKGTLLVGAGRYSVEAEAETCIPEGAGSRCSPEAAGRRNVEVVAAHSILEEEAGRRVFGVAADSSILGEADSKRLVFHLVDGGT